MILRGGSWLDTLRPVTASFRGAWSHLAQRHTTGFRICITPEDTMQVVRDPVQREGSFRVLRGGSWTNFGRFCRSANRNANTPGHQNDGLGFRVALEGVSA